LESAADLWIPFLVDSRRYPSIFDVVRDRYGIKSVAEATTTLHRSSDDAAALMASANKPWRNTGATCSQIRGPGLEGRACLRCIRTQRKQPFPGLAAMRT
jgi:hypothetical protein